MTDTVRYPLVLALVCAVAAAALAVTYSFTKPRIEAREQAEETGALDFVRPGDAEEFVLVLSGDEGGPVYVARSKHGDKPAAYAAVGVHHGYSSDIKVMAGVYPDNRIVAIRVLSAQETPGLGQRIMEIRAHRTIWSRLFGRRQDESHEINQPWFQWQFRGKALDRLVLAPDEQEPTPREEGPNPEKHIAAVTGATISSNAVTEAVRQAVAKIKRFRRSRQKELATHAD